MKTDEEDTGHIRQGRNTEAELGRGEAIGGVCVRFRDRHTMSRLTVSDISLDLWQLDRLKEKTRRHRSAGLRGYWGSLAAVPGLSLLNDLRKIRWKDVRCVCRSKKM